MILPLEKQVCNQILAKKLKELGVKQESLFYWDSHATEKIQKGYGITSDGEFSAFTSSELGEMLPNSVGKYSISSYSMTREEQKKGGHLGWIDGEPVKGRGYCVYLSGGLLYGRDRSYVADTEADARAKMLIYLIENNLVNLEDINV
jgi:hypothetical protein